MAVRDFTKALLERRYVERAGEVQKSRSVVSRVVRLQLVEEPQSLLSKREGR
jgi:hypothetical protein